MITFIIIPFAIVSFRIGKDTERLQRNKLIKLGKLPRPTNRNLNHDQYWANH